MNEICPVVPQPVYSNMAELKNEAKPRPLESDGSSHTSIGSSGYGSQPNIETHDGEYHFYVLFCTSSYHLPIVSTPYHV